MPERTKTFHDLRLEHNIKVEELAVDLGTPYPTLMTIDRGMGKPSVELAEKIYVYFDVPVGTIIWGWNKTELPRGRSSFPRSTEGAE